MLDLESPSIRQWRRVFIVLGVLALLAAYPPLNWFPLAYLAPIFLFLCLSLSPQSRSFQYGYFFGFLFNLFSLYWIFYVTAFGWVFAAFLQALYWGIFAWGVRFLMVPLFESHRLRYRLLFVLGAAALWTLLEWVRVVLPGFGFGWDLLSYSQALFSPFIQIADTIGAYGVSFLIMLMSSLIFVSLWDFIRKVGHRGFHILFYLSVLAAVFFSVLSLGLHKMITPLESKEIRVGVVQGNIPQDAKWEAEMKLKIIEKYTSLSELLIADKPDMAVWPEASYPGFLDIDLVKSGIQALIQRSKMPYLIGSVRYEHAKLYNSAVWSDPQGEIEAYYDKQSLVPFGEYVPLKWAFFFLEKLAYSFGVGDFTPGDMWTVFRGPRGFKFSSLVCFENVFPNVTRQFAENGAQFFVVITNDAWFQKSRAPYEHFYASIFRAVETRRPFVHAANTGVSGFIDAKGRILKTLQDRDGKELFISGVLAHPIAPQSTMTLYVRWGKWLPALMSLLVWLSFTSVLVFNKTRRPLK